MLGKIFAVIVITSFISSGISGNMSELSNAIVLGADEAVDLSISMLGIMCLWSGIIRVLDKVGFTAFITKLISPILKIIYPNAFKKNIAVKDIAADYSANLLGLGNAALPIGIRAMKGLKELGLPSNDTANNEMIMFAVLNTTPIQLIPTTLISLRTIHGSSNPTEILLPIWICSIATTILGVIICKFVFMVSKR